MRPWALVASLLLAVPAHAHKNVNLLDHHLGATRARAMRTVRKLGCKVLKAKERGFAIDFAHRTLPVANFGKRLVIVRCTDTDWPQAAVRELHFDRNRLFRVVVHIDPRGEPDPRSGAPWTTEHKLLKAHLSEHLGDPDISREALPDAFAQAKTEALRKRRGGFWNAWFRRMGERIDIGLRLSGDRQYPEQIRFYVDLRDRKLTRRMAKRSSRRIRPNYGH
jgi:hypothetical protein